MEPLIALVVGFTAARLAGLLGADALAGWQPALRAGLVAMFLLTSIAHFAPALRPDLVDMVPPWMPRAGLLVTITGLLEAAGAIGLIIPATARWAAGGLIALMIAVFPANVSAARRNTAQGDRLGPRTLLQILYIAAAAAILVRTPRHPAAAIRTA
ncbi:hypothetical protein PUR61_34895 [Streptomyces sp. BE20]|uniref:DoxX family protein n=1 Tax=unclassified Streptomyces TaxID=2593676 RepID=UPI002E7758A7|nr:MULTISPECIES: hypothetical protein [unclassified Streptomyces]MED7954665.1 hypothetical protein [Streptomyces sp. BE303]MEE1827342.1 hypothetical protein [Streptomyces sp. BE20]